MAKVFAVNMFMDEKGHKINELVPRDGGPTERRGVGLIKTPTGAVDFQFPVPTSISLDEAFDKFESMGKEAIDNFKKNRDSLETKLETLTSSKKPTVKRSTAKAEVTKVTKKPATSVTKKKTAPRRASKK